MASASAVARGPIRQATLSFSTNSCILVRATAGAPAESPVNELHRPAGEHVVALLQIKREALLHLDAAGGEGPGLDDEKSDPHGPGLCAQHRGRGQHCACAEHTLQNGSAADQHAFLPGGSLAPYGGTLAGRSLTLAAAIFALRTGLVTPFPAFATLPARLCCPAPAHNARMGHNQCRWGRVVYFAFGAARLSGMTGSSR